MPWGHGQRSPRGLQRRVLPSSCLLHTPGEPSVQAAAGQRQQAGVSLHNLARAPAHTRGSRLLRTGPLLPGHPHQQPLTRICIWWAVVGGVAHRLITSPCGY